MGREFFVSMPNLLHGCVPFHFLDLVNHKAGRTEIRSHVFSKINTYVVYRNQ